MFNALIPELPTSSLIASMNKSRNSCSGRACASATLMLYATPSKAIVLCPPLTVRVIGVILEHNGNGGNMVEWEGRDPRLIRLFDLADDDRIQISCPCGNTREYGGEYFQRHMRFASDMLVYDLRYRVGCCSRCNRNQGFAIQITKLGYPPSPPVVIVERDRV